VKAIILAGGSGTRLWPLSRSSYPKQFLKFADQRSLLSRTVERIGRVLSLNDIVVVTNSEYRDYVTSEIGGTANVIIEPVGRNTAPAITLGLKYCQERLGCQGDETFLVCPSDHMIKQEERFVEYISLAEQLAGRGKLVTFGVNPMRPESGYGYIKIGMGCEIGGSKYWEVKDFAEKPDAERAKQYIAEGGYYWNAGIFAFSMETISEEFRRHAPEFSDALGGTYDALIRGFGSMPNISIDYAVMEKSSAAVMLPLDLCWTDVGSWDSLFDVLSKDENGNAMEGDILAIDTNDAMIMGNNRLIAAIGVKDCVIVDTPDALLISKKGDTQRIKEVVTRLKEQGRREILEPVTTHRPWGSYTLLEKGASYKIKRIVVKPGKNLSLQMHYHRSEHWVVVSGTARVKVGEQEYFVHKNESTYVPPSTLHRLENPGKVPLEIIEVQNGEYLEEDDIIRFNDICSCSAKHDEQK
jgi:mannose-1-phosphate guanylyltransferase / mannose-6-phosphate isomerase